MPIIDREPLHEEGEKPYLITEIMDGLNKELARNARRKKRREKMRLASLEQMRWLLAIPDFGQGEDALEEEEDIPESEDVAAATEAATVRRTVFWGWTRRDVVLVGTFFSLAVIFVTSYVVMNY